ncbi:hypothetical protein [Mycolicibacterium houstonense]|uniref:hypothetical protein n=1 Tax=Mycolicibacterium houstonense TaxID=146021 RepID=UPI003F9C3987
MTVTTLVDLRGRATWETGILTAETFRWPTDAPRVALADLVTAIVASSIVNAGAQVITPASLDGLTGGIRRRTQRYQGPVFQVTRDLLVDDLLVPPNAEAPVLRVTEHLTGALVSTRFIALRPTGNAKPLWIWAVLNSKSGRELRQRLLVANLHTGGAKARVLDLAIPVPDLIHQIEVEPTLRVIEARTHRDEEEAPSTWWRTVDLRDKEWRLLLASPEPERLDDGEPLQSYAEMIERGRALPRDQITDITEVGIPIADGASLAGRPIRRWAKISGTSDVMAAPGDVLVAAIGSRAHATVASVECVIDRSVIRIQLKDPHQAEAVVRYLNGSAGYGFRQVLLRRTVVPELTVADLSRMPVPAAELVFDDPGSALPLALQLEHALWRN